MTTPIEKVRAAIVLSLNKSDSVYIREALAEALAELEGKAIVPIEPDDVGKEYTIDHDGFTGTVIGSYTTREGKEGVVLQQTGTKVVHVYGRKWLAPPYVPEEKK